MGVMEKYGAVIISIAVLLVFFIGNWFIISKMGDLINTAEKLINAGQPIANALTQALSKLDTICSASGIRVA